jgi:uncharacterized protein YigE (DUF2233 family)
MMKNVLFFVSIFLFAACNLKNGSNQISEKDKQQIEKEVKKIGKQIIGAAAHADAQKDFIAFEAKQNVHKIKMYWKDDNGNILGNLQAVKNYAASKGDTLLYACNGGMYMQNQDPLGWYIENGKEIKPLNTKKGNGNFYLNPKGVFGVWRGQIAKVESVQAKDDIKAVLPKKYTYLTQSGPLLIDKGKINALFDPKSANLNIRNGVGILPNGHALFAMSTAPINFFNFAKYFFDKGCKQALYLDGFVSRTYCPSEHYEQLDGQFGVMIGVVK